VYEKIEQRMDTYFNQRAASVPSALASPAFVDAMAPGTRVVDVVRRREEEDNANDQTSVKKYKLSRDLNTVPQLWEEWTSCPVSLNWKKSLERSGDQNLQVIGSTIF
jgi:hypothetical protein